MKELEVGGHGMSTKDKNEN